MHLSPLCDFFLERTALIAAAHRTTLDVSHISGERNVTADALSRPHDYETPADCLEPDRIRVFPEGAHLSWKHAHAVWVFLQRGCWVVCVGAFVSTQQRFGSDILSLLISLVGDT